MSLTTDAISSSSTEFRVLEVGHMTASEKLKSWTENVVDRCESAHRFFGLLYPNKVRAMRVILTDAVRNECTAEAFLSALRDEDPFLFNDLETNGPRKTFVRIRPPTEPFDLWSANRGLRNFFETQRDEFNVVDILVGCNLLTVEEYDDIRRARERLLFLVLHEIMTRASLEHVAFLECLEGLYREVWPSLDTEVISQDDTHQQRIEKTFSRHGNYDIIHVNSAMTPKAAVEDMWWRPICTIHRAQHAFGCGHATWATCDRKTGNKCPLCRRRKEKVCKEAFAVKNAHLQCPECKGPKMVLIYDGPNGEGCHHVACECAIKNHRCACGHTATMFITIYKM